MEVIHGLPRGVKWQVQQEMGRPVLRIELRGVAVVIGAGSTTDLKGNDEPWATVYRIEAAERWGNNKILRDLLLALKKHYKTIGWDFAVSRAETPWQKFNIDLAKVPVREECTGVIVDRLKVAAI